MVQEELFPEILETKINLKGNYAVRQANEFINLPQKLTLNQSRIFLYMVSQIKPTDTDVKKYRISFRELEKLIGGSKNSFSYQKVKELLKDLAQKTIVIGTDKNTERITHYIQSVDLDKFNGYVELEVDPKLKPYFLQLKAKYTKYDLINVIPLQSVYSVRLYELLKQYEGIHKRAFTIQQFREVLNLQSYKLYGDIKRRVILQAQKEINELTDIKFSFEEIKDNGKKVVGLEFSIYSAKTGEPIGETSDPNSLKALENLSYLGFSDIQAAKLLENKNSQRVLLNIEYAEKHCKDRSTIQGFTVYCIEHDCVIVKSDMQIVSEQKLKEVESIEKIKETFDSLMASKINMLKKNLLNEKVKNEFIAYIKSKFKSNATALLGKSAAEFTIADLAVHKLFSSFLGDEYLEEDERDFNIYLEKNHGNNTL